MESENVRQYVPAGTYVEISLDADNQANSAPAFPHAYDLEEMSRLPLALLVETIEPAPPLTPELIEAEIEEEETLTGDGSQSVNGEAIVLLNGRYQQFYTSVVETVISEDTQSNCDPYNSWTSREFNIIYNENDITEINLAGVPFVHNKVSSNFFIYYYSGGSVTIEVTSDSSFNSITVFEGFGIRCDVYSYAVRIGD